MRQYSTTYQAISLLDAPKIHTDLIWDLTILLGSIALIYFTAIFFFRNKISGKARKVSALKTKLSPMISEFIFYEDSASKEEKSLYINLKVKIRDMLRDDFTRKVVSEILLDLRKDVSGSAQDRLFDLFQDLDLHKKSYEKLKSWRWEQISRGIEELTRMEVSDSYEFITKFVNDKRSTIRKQAEIGAVTLHSEGINYFLDTTTNRISEWQQLKLMEVLSNKTEFVPPSFMAWLTSTNKFVVLFALRLIKYYDQNDAKASIIELVKHRNNQIKQEALDCIKAFYIVEALPILKKVFWSCSTDVKISILGTIGELGAPKDIPFLKSIGNKERSYSVTSKALSAINSIAPESILPTKGIADIENIEIPEDVIAVEPTESISELPEQEIMEQVEVVGEGPAVTVANLKEQESFEQIEKEELRAVDGVSAALALVSDFTAPILSDNTTTDVRDIEVIFSTDLLPLIEESTGQDQNNTNEIMETPINSIEVIFEEVQWKYIPKEATTKTLDINNMLVVSTDLDFLPIVIAEEEEETPSSDLANTSVDQETVLPTVTHIEEQVIVAIDELVMDYKETIFVPIEEEEEEVEEQDVEEIQVIFEEVIYPKTTILLDTDVPASKNFDIEVEFNNDRPPLHIQRNETSVLFDIEVDATAVETLSKPLNELEVICEIVHSEEKNEEVDLPLWLLNEIAKENTAGQERDTIKMEGQEWESKESQMVDKINSYFNHLPKSEDFNIEVIESVQLLDDIALFGDEREIPLLQELMKKENKTVTKERIDALMKRFMGTDAYGAVDIDTKPYSVFEELFRNCDTESKLILLGEIVAIGDKKEIHFLEQLVNDTNKKIRKKAGESLQLLKDRFDQVELELKTSDVTEYESLLNRMELMPPKESDMFEIDFELTPEESKTDNDVSKKPNWFTSFIKKFTTNQPDR